MNGANDVVIAHELLHTVGATDKYTLADDAPRFPDGYGDPAQRPLYPQLTAECLSYLVYMLNHKNCGRRLRHSKDLI